MCSKWELVLIEWINCLKMARPIDNLQSLQDGEFLANFMHLLTQTHLTTINIIPEIKTFIKTEYPSLNFNLSLTNNSITNLTSRELALFLSILMHHSCIVNQQESVTSSMCFNISKEYQIYIKRFLEQMTLSRGETNLDDIITKCFSPDESNAVTQWESAGDSPLCSRTPLKEYLQTPFKTRFVGENENEIRKLRTCLELESFEKVDLREELKEHKEQIEVLKEQCKRKSQEVSRLRNELLDAERSKSPQSATKMYDLKTRLKSEMADMEKYVLQLQKELELLQTDKDLSNKKLKTSESQLKSATEKIFSLEIVCDQISVKNHDQQLELETLRSNCSDLNTLLSELRNQNCHNRSIFDMSFDNVPSSSQRRSYNLNDTASCEDLACSVVEVQLREAHEENSNLKEELNKSVLLNKEITEEMDRLKVEVAELGQKFDESVEDRRNLTVKFEQLQNLFDDLQVARKETLDNLGKLTVENREFSTENQCLTQANAYISDKLQESILDICTLKNNLAESESSKAFAKGVNEMISKQNDTLRDESAYLQRLLAQKILQLTEEHNNRISLEAAFKNLDTKFDLNLKNLERALFGTNQDMYSDKNKVFESLLEEMQVKESKQFDAKAQLDLKLKEFELEVGFLEEKVDDLERKKLVDLKVVGKLQDSLKEAGLKYDILELSIGQKDSVIRRLKLALAELEATVKALNELQTKCARQESELRLDRAITDSVLLNFTKYMENINKILQTKSLVVVREVAEDMSKILEEDEHLKQIHESWTHNDKDFLLEAAKINQNVTSLILELESKDSELKSAKEESKSLRVDFEEITVQYELTKSDLASQKQDLQANISILDEAKVKLQQELLKQNQFNDLEAGKFDQLSKSFQQLAEDKISYVAKCEAYKEDIKSLTEKLVVSETLCDDKDDVLAETSRELLTCKLELEVKKQGLTEIKEELNKLYAEINLIKVELGLAKEECESNRTKVELLEKEIDILGNLKDDLLKRNLDLEANNLRVIQQLTLKNEDYNRCIEDIRKSKQKKELEISNLNQSLKECNANIFELNNTFANNCSKHDLEIKDMNEEKAKLKDEVLKLQEKGESYLEDIKLIKSNIAKLVQKCFNITQMDKIPQGDLNNLRGKNCNLSMKDLSNIFDKLHIILRYFQKEKVDFEANKLVLNKYKEKDIIYEESLDRIQILTDSNNVINANLEHKESLLRNLRKEMKGFKQICARNLRENAAILETKDNELMNLQEGLANLTQLLAEQEGISGAKEEQIGNLRRELEDLNQVFADCQKHNELALGSKENQLVDLRVNFKKLEDIFALNKIETETINECKSDLTNKISIIEEENVEKLKIFEKQFGLLQERCNQLEHSSGKFAENCIDFEEIKTEKNQLLEKLISKDTLIEELTSSLQNNFELTNKQIVDLQSELAEKVLDLTKVSAESFNLKAKSLELEKKLVDVINERDSFLESKKKTAEDAEVHIKAIQEKSKQLQKDLEERLNSAQVELVDFKQIQNQLQIALGEEKLAKEALEVRILHLENEKVNLLQIKFRYKMFIAKISEDLPENGIAKIDSADDFVVLQELSNQIEVQIIDIMKSKNDLEQSIEALKQDQKSKQDQICSLEEVQMNLTREKEDLFQKFEQIQMEKTFQNQHNYETLSNNYDLLQAKYDQYKNYRQINENKNLDLEDKLQKLAGTNKSISDNYSKFRQKYQAYKSEVESLLKDRNLVEGVINNLSEKISSLQSKSIFITEEAYKSHFDTKNSLETINTDLKKQFSRCSKISANLCFNLNNIFDAATTGIIEDKFDLKQEFDRGNLIETKQKLEEIKDLAEDAIRRVASFVIPGERVRNVLKESNTNDTSSKELEDLRKKFHSVKQKLILVDNAKNNYERKIQTLREQNNKLAQNQQNMDSEAHYQTLLKQHLETKEEHVQLITECEVKYKQLIVEFDQYKKDSPKDNVNKVLEERSMRLDRETHKLRRAYGNLMSDKSKMELENVTMKKVLDDRNGRIGDLMVIKEAYEKLLEDNTKVVTDLDTLKYKRVRDREEFVRILKNEKDESEVREGKRVQDIRNEYELKLEKMKDKMVKLYKEEVDKEMQKVFSEKSNNSTLTATIDHLRDELTHTQLKLHLATTDRPQRHLHPPDNNPIPSLPLRTPRMRTDNTPGGATATTTIRMADRRWSTMPRHGAGLDVLEEIRIHKRTSISASGGGHGRGLASDFVMEDEDDMFNNKYLADLKEGRCDPTNTRMSELVYRNSMCLPHLKSSYPCETQFASPSGFNEDDIKLGANLMPPTSAAHLPPPHPMRLRKDAGTTSYKRPGPPTPSKNGGRASLSSMDRAQGAILPLREVNDGRASIATSVVQQARNRLTPTRLKALFSGKGRGNAGGSNTAVEQATFTCQCTCHTTVTVTARLTLPTNQKSPKQTNQKTKSVKTIPISSRHTIIHAFIRRLLRQRYGNSARDCQVLNTLWWFVAKHVLFLTCLACASAGAVRYFHGDAHDAQIAKPCCRY